MTEIPNSVPEKAFCPKTDEGREWWEGVASGSVILDDETLDFLLEKTDEKKC